jgi:Ca2+-binding EF-hand superfamily protein
MNAKTDKAVSLIVITLFTVSFTALAQEQDGKKRGNEQSRLQHLEKYDTDGDGKLSPEEREAIPEGLRNKRPGNRESWEQLREKYDTDGDGKLSPEEREAMPEGLRNMLKKRHTERVGEAGGE